MIQALKALGGREGGALSRNSLRANETLAMIELRVPKRTQAIERIGFEQSWVRDSLYYRGKQKFALIGNQPVDIPLKPHEVRYKANFIKVYVSRAVAKVLGIEGHFSAVPQSGGVASREQARVTMAVWDHQKALVDWEDVKYRAHLWAAICGTAFVKNCWDPSKGDLDRFYWADAQDHAVLDAGSMSPSERQFREQNGLYEDLAPGEIECEEMPPFQAYPDPASKGKLKHCRWFAQHQFLQREAIAETFGVDVKDISEEDSTASSQRYEEALALVSSGMTTQGYGSAPPENKNRAWLTQMWERPSSKHPKGRYVATAGGLVLRDTDNPYAADRTRCLFIPFAKLDWQTAPGSFWGLSLVADLVSAQYRRNESRSKTLAYEQLFANPGLLVPINCGVSPAKVTNALGPVYEYNPAMGEPKPFPVPLMPPDVARNAATCEAEMAQLASQSDIDSSKMPGQMRSGAAFAALNTDRDMALSLTMKNSLRFERDCGEQFLALAQLYYSGERVAMYRGPSGEWAAQSFLGANLTTNIRILTEPGQMETSQNFRAQLGEFVQAGIFNPATNPQDRQIVLKALRYRTAEEAIDDVLQHELRQEQEILEMIGNPGAAYPVLPYEDHVAHMRVLVHFFHSDEFKRLDPDRQTLLQSHWAMHQAAVQAAQEAQLEMIARTQSTPSAPGVASQPK